MTWLAEAEHIKNDRNKGGTYASGVPYRFVLHSTEVVPSSIDGARKLAARHEYPPHLWAWPERNWLGQTVPLDRSAFALKQPKGTPPTNRMRAIQVEVIGYASDPTATDRPRPKWHPSILEWIGVEVLAPIIRAGYRVNLDHVAPTAGRVPQVALEMGWASWRGFDGVCAHQNVPAQDHWDIGDNPLAIVAEAARRELYPQPGPDPEDDDMPPAPAPVIANDGHVWCFVRGTDAALWGQRDYGEWKRYGGQITSGPSAIPSGVDGVMVFARGGDGGTWRAAVGPTTPTNGTDGKWVSEGGRS